MESFKSKKEEIGADVEEGLKDYWAPTTKSKGEMIEDGKGGITIESIELNDLSEDERNELVDAVIRNDAEKFEIEPDFGEEERRKINQEGFKKIVVGEREIFLDIHHGTLTNAGIYEKNNDKLKAQVMGGYKGVSIYKNENGEDVINIGTPYFAESEYIKELAEDAKLSGFDVRIDENDQVLPEFDKNKSH